MIRKSERNIRFVLIANYIVNCKLPHDIDLNLLAALCLNTLYKNIVESSKT